MISTSNHSVLDLLRKRIADLSHELAERDSVLRERTRHLRVAQSLAHLGSWDWEIESGEVRCSQEWYRIFGRDPGSLTMTLEIFLSSLFTDDHDRVVAAINAALEGTVPYDVEYRIVRPDGDVRTIHCCGEVLRDDRGKPCRMSGSVQDITERKRMEETVRESEDRYRTLVELSPSGVFVFSEGRTVYVNHTGAVLLGANDPKEILDRPMSDFIHPEHHDEVRKNVTRLLTGNVSVHSAERIVVKMDGTSVPVQVEAARIMWNGRAAILVLFSDITDRKRAEDELRRSHTFLRQVIDADPNFIFAKDRDGRFTMANKAVADCYGTTVEHLIGQSDADFNPNWEEVEFSREKDLQVINSLEEYFIAEEKITDWSGKTRWLQTVKRPILDAHGQVHMVLGASTDITERMQMEEMLLRREEDLSAALQDRERISQDLHDGILQSLYAVGLGLEACKLLIDQQPEYPEERFVATLDQAIGHLNDVMGEVRNFIMGLESHITQGGDFPTALRTMVHSMCAADSSTCRVRIDDAAGSHISAEQEVHVMNIAREALSNSLRHSRATRIIVSLRQFTGSVCLAITDNGIGFDPSSTHAGGRGLENMAARAQKIGALFAVRSEPFKGTRILLDLPKGANKKAH